MPTRFLVAFFAFFCLVVSPAFAQDDPAPTDSSEEPADSDEAPADSEAAPSDPEPAAPPAAIEGSPADSPTETAAESEAAPANDDSERPKAFRTWHPRTYAWAHKGIPGTFILGGISAAMWGVGDQLSLDFAQPAWGGKHIPYGDPGDPEAEDVVKGYAAEILYLYGFQIAIPSLAGGAVGVIVGAAGADLQMSKTIGSFAGTATLIPVGVAHIVRWQQFYQPEWDANKSGSATEGLRFYYIIPGAMQLAMGITDIAVGSLLAVLGALYASETLIADETPGLLPPVRLNMPSMGLTPDGRGLAFQLSGSFR